jgi:hypothetical protein
MIRTQDAFLHRTGSATAVSMHMSMHNKRPRT